MVGLFKVEVYNAVNSVQYIEYLSSLGTVLEARNIEIKNRIPNFKEFPL